MAPRDFTEQKTNRDWKDGTVGPGITSR